MIAVATLTDQRQDKKEEINVKIPKEKIQEIINAARSETNEEWKEPMVARATIKAENIGTVVQNISFAIPNETIKEFFEDYLGWF